MIDNLRKYGFSFPEIERELCNPGNVFFFEGEEYIIGGKCDGTPSSEQDERVAGEGKWLPTTDQLLLWLQWKVDNDITIKYDSAEMYFYSEIQDPDGNTYTGSGPDLLCSLYKLILKILKNK
jgi:hypothetical protein